MMRFEELRLTLSDNVDDVDDVDDHNKMIMLVMMIVDDDDCALISFTDILNA